MKNTSIAGAMVLSVIGIAAVAHNGATGVVLDRMNGMSAMRTVMRELAPMMQGQVPYNVRTVQTGAATLMAHSGDNMNKLFPEGPIPDASFAKPAVWDDWERFTELSEELRTYAMGLGTAAPNGLTAPMPEMATDMEMSDDTAMEMAPEPEGFSAAQLMGIAPAVGAPEPAADAVNTLPEQIEDLISEVDFSMMAAPSAFEMIGQTCAACHAQFRNGS
ncbi:MAG: cytochrome c [Paracoccaceae bacterium]|nr:cytochrome c [Paracoccaceae bacterium]